MDTNTISAGFFAQADSEWSDAFAPLQQSRTTTKKAWERAPVPAHAPRLQGQKIWKRAGLRSSRLHNHQNENENYDPAQVELERDGNGARKKARYGLLVEGKDALVEYEEVMVDGVSVMVVSPRKVDREGETGREGENVNGALVVPRKRTNANHLITPRRGVRRTPLEVVGGESVKSGLGLGGQMARESPRKILLNDVVEGGIDKDEKKPVRRRKSMRKSGGRRLTVSSIEEEIATSAGDSVEVGKETDVATPMVAETEQEIVEKVADEISALEPLATQKGSHEASPVEISQLTPNSDQDASPTEIVTDEDEAATFLRTGTEPDISETVVCDEASVSIESFVEDNIQEVVPPIEIDHEALESTTEDGSLATSNATDQLEISEVADVDDIKPDTSSNPIESPKQPTVVLQMDLNSLAETSGNTPQVSIEPIEETHIGSSGTSKDSNDLVSYSSILFANGEPVGDSLSPIKVPATPRRGKKAAAQPQSVRRSTRTKRTSSLPPGVVISNDGHNVANIPSPMKSLPQGRMIMPRPDNAKLSEHTELPDGITREEAHENSEQVPEISPTIEVTIDVYVLEPAVEPPAESHDCVENAHPSQSHDSTSIDKTEEIHDTTKPNLHCSEEVGSNDAVLSSEQPANEHIQYDVDDVLAEALARNNSEEPEEAELEGSDCVSSSSESVAEEETITQDFNLSAPDPDIDLELLSDDEDVLLSNQLLGTTDNNFGSDNASEEDLEEFGPVSIATVVDTMLDATTEIDTLPESSTPDPSMSELVKAISENAPSTNYDEDDTDLLRNFLTRVKANKEAKAKSTTTKRKRSLPHSPIHPPLASEPSSPQSKIDFDVSLPVPSPAKRRKRGETSTIKDDMTEPQSIRRSGRTRLPVKTSSLPAPSFIPVRRLGQDGDNTITLRKNEDKELVTLTKMNTRKNKGNALSAPEFIAKMGMQKEDPALRHQALKQKFDEKATASQKGLKKKKSVVWAEEIAQFQSIEEESHVVLGEENREKARKERKKEIAVAVGVKEKKSIPVRATSSSSIATVPISVLTEDKKTPAVKVGVRSSRISMGMVANGTPAPKRKMRGMKGA